MKAIDKLDNADKRRVRSLISAGCGFLSCTIPPAPSFGNVRSDEITLESVTGALDYLRGIEVGRVVVQIKAMGSRATLFLDEDRGKCKLATRNGFAISGKDKHPEIDILVNIWHDWYCRQDNFEGRLVLDCELMPWSYLSEGLIASAFEPHYTINRKRLETLRDVPALAEAQGYSDSTLEWAFTLLEEYREAYESFTSDELPWLAPFDILSDTDLTMEQRDKRLSLLPVSVNDHIQKGDKSLVVNLDDAEGVENIHQLFNKVKVHKLEGIVIKPADLMIGESKLPAMKVRTEDYLKLVYGYDFTEGDKYHELVGGKDIKNKVEASKKQYAAGCALLKIKDFDKSVYNEDYANAIIKAHKSEAEYDFLDPRL